MSADRTIPDAEFVKRAVHAAHVGRPKAERWTHVMTAFSLGSTFATQLCRRFGFDPYEKVGDEAEEASDADHDCPEPHGDSR